MTPRADDDPVPPTDPALNAFWIAHYTNKGLCGLCGNSGRIDARRATSAAGVRCGGIWLCICPNGQVMRSSGARDEPCL